MKLHLQGYRMHITGLLMCFAILFSDSAFAQWQQIGNLYGEPVYAVRKSTSRMYAMTLYGVYDSNNNGTSWNRVTPLYLTNIIERLSASNDTIVAYAQPASYISTNDGNTWSTLTGPSGGMSFPSDLIVNNGRVFMPMAGDYLYYTDNAGTSWNQVTNGLTTSFLNCAWAEGNTVFVGSDDGVFKSTDNGLNFTFSGLSGEYVNRIYYRGSYVVVYTTNGISLSDDDGATWTPFDPAFFYPDVMDFAINGNVLYAATTGELIKTNLTAPAWNSLIISPDIGFYNSVYNTGTELMASCNRGVFISNDNGVTWLEKNTGIIPVNTSAVTALGNDTIFAGNSIYGISRHTGNSWDFLANPLLNCFDLITVGSDVYASSELGIYKSSDGGDNWNFINVNVPNPVVAYAADIAVKDTLILGASLQSGVLRSGDSGATWALQSSGIAPSLVSCVAISGNNVIAGTFDNGLYTSTDGGLTFTQTGIAGELVYDLIVAGSNVIAATNSANGNYISIDDGATWLPTMSTFFDNLAFSNGYVIATAPTYVEVSIDSGMTYQALTPSPAGTGINSVTANDTEIIIGTSNDGVWKTTFSQILSLEEPSPISLTGIVIPNVFTETAHLHTDENTVASRPEFRVFDIGGKLVFSMQVTNTVMTVNAGELQSGMYFYGLYSGNSASRQGKMIVYRK